MSKLTRALAELAKRADAGDEVARQGIRAYHGSPHDFPPVRELEMPDGAVVYQSMDDAVPEGARVIKEHPLGRLDMSKIGTGEGAQAYSRGLYFAEREKTAEGYRKAGTGSRVKIDGEDLLSPKSRELAIKDQEYNYAVGFLSVYGDADQAMRAAADNDLPEVADRIKSLVDSGRITTTGKGSMYEVNIAATPDEFIDWDLPLDEQSESVMNALNKTDWYQYAEEGAYNAAERRGDNAYGMDLVRWLEEDGAEDAVQMLKDAGIKGVQYADAQTRFGKGPKTKNYVVYDDKLITISKKYGISIPAAAAVLAGTMTPEEAQAGFIGPTSKIFINEAANLAKSMDAAGKTRDEIWKATGEQFGAPMLKGPEGVWKQEISDQGNYIPAEQEAGLRQGRTPTFGAALQGPDGPSSMVEAYPRLQDSRITPIVSDTTRGSFNPRSGDIRLSTGDSLVNRSNEEMASTLQHEGQHFIQEQENWAKGGNPEHSARMLDAAKQDLVEAQEKAQSVKMQYEDKLEELGYRNAIDLSRTAYKLSEVDRLKGYLDGYYNGGKLTDKRRHILNSGSVMDPNAEYRMRMDINWAKRHRPQAERDQNYADYIQGVIAAVEKDMDPQLVEQVRNSGVKNPYAKYQREISNARAKAQEAFGVDMETWNGTVAEMNQFVNRYERGGGEKLYRDLAGEVEARTVQERLPMSMDERIASPPWEGQEWTNTPPEKQVFIDDYGRLATATMGGMLGRCRKHSRRI
jgi:cell division septum initiation protein DivIVA